MSESLTNAAQVDLKSGRVVATGGQQGAPLVHLSAQPNPICVTETLQTSNASQKRAHNELTSGRV